MKLPQRGTVLQFIKFGAVGVSNTLISFAVYYIFLFVDKSLYLLGNVAGWVVSVANAFFWNNKYVFKENNDNIQDILKKLVKTYFSYGATFLLSTILLYVEVDILGWSAALCPVVNLLVTIPINFVLNKYWAFSVKDTKRK